MTTDRLREAQNRAIQILLVLFAFYPRGYARLPDPSLEPSNDSKKWNLFADVLFWNLEETCTEWAFVIDPRFASQPAAPFTGSYETVLTDLAFDWSTGVRTGFSSILPHDQWDSRFYYTWYHTRSASHIIPPPGNVIQSQFIATNFLVSLPDFPLTFREAKIKWNVLFNMFNWNIGRICQVGQFLSLRPYLGVQGGWIHQNIDVDWIRSDGLIPYDALEFLKHHFWGVGPEVGVNSKWNLGTFGNHALSIWGDFAQVFMWGHWSFNEEAHTTITLTTINTQPDREMGSLTFQSAAGFVWDYSPKNSPLFFTVQLGYEMQIWMEQLQFFQHFSGLLHNALTLQGATARLQFAF